MSHNSSPPKLRVDLDLNGKDIVTSSNRDLNLTPVGQVL